MDEQATQLRRLVRQVRHAAVMATGPPVLAVVAANGSVDAIGVCGAIHSEVELRGMRVGSTIDSAEESAEEFDWQLLDAGVGFSSAKMGVWQRASVVLLITTTEDQAVLDSYATLKLASRETPLPAIEIVVQGNCEDIAAQRAYDRLTDTCKRYLSCTLSGLTIAGNTRPGDKRDVDTRGICTLVDRLLVQAPAGHSVANPLAEKATFPL